MEDNYPEIPEEIKKLLESGETIDEIRIDGEGNWTHNGQAFLNERIIELFNRSVDVTRDGEYVIHYADFVYPIVVEDVPVLVTGVRFEGNGSKEKVFVTVRARGEELLDVDTLYIKSNNSLYCRVCGGRFPAKFMRSPSFQVLERLEESDDTFHLSIGGKRIVLQEKVD